MATTLNKGPAAVPRGPAGEPPAGEPAAGPADDLADSADIRESLRQLEQLSLLYDRYATVLHRYAGRRVGDDLVAATFLAAFRARQRYDLAHASAWPSLLGILTKEIARRHRTEKAASVPWRVRRGQASWLARNLASQVSAKAAPATNCQVQ
ncbi:MAG TPA: hypothetical protein VMU94_26435 [Streptosporangiaceae bacterium]|nr:hypothetical protein [Streptosporangiaceae bacterium]